MAKVVERRGVIPDSRDQFMNVLNVTQSLLSYGLLICRQQNNSKHVCIGYPDNGRLWDVGNTLISCCNWRSL